MKQSLFSYKIFHAYSGSKVPHQFTTTCFTGIHQKTKKPSAKGPSSWLQQTLPEQAPRPTKSQFSQWADGLNEIIIKITIPDKVSIFHL